MSEVMEMIATDERRRDQRYAVPRAAEIHLCDERGRKLGKVLVLARGGVLVQTSHSFERERSYQLWIADEGSGIRRAVTVQVLDRRSAGLVLRFDDLQSDAALEIGVMIGRYYSQIL